MKNTCLKCGKTKEVDEFGYCENCSSKLFKKEKYTTVEQRKRTEIRNIIVVITIILLLILLGLFFKDTIIDTCSMILYDDFDISQISFKISMPSFFDNTANIILTENNYEELSKEYVDKHEGEDELYYFSYAVLYYTIQNSLNSNFSSNSNYENDEIKLYKDILGKTINELIEEGKKLMEKNNVSINDIKKSVNEIDNNENIIIK